MTRSESAGRRDEVSLHALLASALLAELQGAWRIHDQQLATALLCHALAGALVFCALARPVSRHAAGAAALLCLGMPLFGLLGLWSVVVPAMRASGRAALQPLRTLALPSAPLARARRSSRPTPARGEPTSTHERRMAEMGVLRHMAAERALPLLRRGLTDPIEDVRLLAFAILEQRERAVRLRVDVAERQLAAQLPADGGEGGSFRERLALAHALFELVQCGFVAGEAAESMLQQVRDHVRRALTARTSMNEGAAVVLLARACLALHDDTEAERALERAEQIGVSDAEVAPLWAELFYSQRRFDRVRNALRAIPDSARRQPGLSSLVGYWLERRQR